MIKGAITKVEDIGILPPLTPMPMHQWLLLIAITAIPISGYIIIFSEMFNGISGMKFAIENREVGSWVLFVCWVVLSSLYIFDAEAWESKCMLWVRFLVLCVTAMLLLVGIFFSADGEWMKSVCSRHLEWGGVICCN